jgi:hypothetical protein
MNVLESSIKLYEWFNLNDSFCLEEDFIKLMIISDNETRDKASLLCALNSLEKYEIIQSEEVDNKKVWIIERPLESLPQKIEIDYATAILIAKIVNEAAQKYKVKDSICEVGNITPENIKDLVVLAGVHFPDQSDTWEDDLENQT